VRLLPDPPESVDFWFNGTMSNVPTAPADPMFRMHHAAPTMWSAKERVIGTRLVEARTALVAIDKVREHSAGTPVRLLEKWRNNNDFPLRSSDFAHALHALARPASATVILVLGSGPMPFLGGDMQ
jgi:hypothetical protein